MDKMKYNISNFPQEIIDELMRPGYGPIELGYRRYDEDVMLVCNYARFPNIHSDAVKWWFFEGLTDQNMYRLWHPAHAAFQWYDKKPGTCYGATHFCTEIIRGEPSSCYMYFCDPSEMVDTEKAAAANVNAIFCGEGYSTDRVQTAVHMHTIRDTYFGCELRQRNLIYGMDENGAADLIMHASHEFANLAEFLPGLYRRETYRNAAEGRW